MSARPSSFTLTKPGPFRLLSTAELLNMPKPVWLIDPIMTMGSLIVLYGPPGEGKSFLAVDMALSIAAGTLWQGCPVQAGPVLYVAGEGAPGLSKRVRAWHVVRGVSPSQTPVAWLTQPIEINGDPDSNLDLLMERIANELEWAPRLIVVDTLARCFEGDENTQLDMGRFVKGVDKLRLAFGCAVLVVHHTRLDATRERGNTALRGAADTMLSVSKSDWLIGLSCTKQKDAEEFPDMQLFLRPVAEFDSCVVGLKRGIQLDNRRDHVLQLIQQHGPLTFTDLVQLTPNIPLTTLKRDLVDLRETEQILRKNAIYSVL